MQHIMQVVIADDCPMCVFSEDVVGFARRTYPNLKIDLLNLSNPDTICPENIFATPTYLLNGQIIFLGNPSFEELGDCLESVGVEMIE